MSRPARLLVFGFDAGHPAELIRWANEGHLPALAGILERGGRAILDVPEIPPGPASSGVLLANWAAHLGGRSRHPAHQSQSRHTDFLTGQPLAGWLDPESTGPGRV